MNGNGYRLTSAFIDKVCKYLMAGAFDPVASELAGVPHAVFQQWFAQGQQKGARGLCRTLYQRVSQAKAHARFLAESKLRQEEPRHWLLHGPGKNTPPTPGWSAAPRAPVGDDNGEQGIMECLALIHRIQKELEPYPEMRIKIAQIIDSLDPQDSYGAP